MRKFQVYGLGSILEYHARSFEHAEFLLIQDHPHLDVFSGRIVITEEEEVCEAE